MVKNFELAKRIENLTNKINDPDTESIIHLDFESFSEAEKVLFRKVEEIEEEFKKTGDQEILFKNAEFLLKPSEIIFRRITELYCYVATTVLACGESREIVDHFFKLHFYNFEVDLAECLEKTRTWTDKEKEEFLQDLKRSGTHLFRFPRGFDKDYCKELCNLLNSKELDEKNDQPSQENNTKSMKTMGLPDTNQSPNSMEGG
jgi:hypothetical protein